MDPEQQRIEEDLRGLLQGDVRCDDIFTQLYASDYSPAAIAHWAARIASWSQGSEPPDAVRSKPATQRRARNVYVYFDNDGSAHAPHNALALQAALRLA